MPHDNRMRIDDEIDTNNDGFVADFEIEEFIQFTFAAICLLPLEKGPDDNGARKVENVLEELADINMNGFIEPEEEMAMEEQQMQLSDLTEQTNAVKIGQILNADFVVIGNLSYIGEVYYLQVKLLSSETTEIIGSSLTNAQSESGFLEMCNNAILLLFK